MKRKLTLLLILFVALTVSVPAVARARLAVAVLVQGDPKLSDSLTEVAVAELAASNGGELVGLLEMRARHQEVASSTLPEPERSAESCLLDVACAHRLTRLLGASHCLLGLVTPASESYAIVWSVLDSASEQQRLLSQTRILRDEARLIAEIRRAVVHARSDADATREPETFVPPLADTAAPIPPLVAADPQSSRVRLALSAPFVVDDRLHKRSTTVYVGAALTTIVLSAAVVTGLFAAGDPKGNTRREAQEDYEHRQRYASTTYGLMLAGGVLGTVTAVSWVWHWH